MYDERTTEYVEPQEEPKPRMLRQMIVQNRQDTESGHRRHAQLLKEIDIYVQENKKAIEAHGERLGRMDEILKRPVEATAIRYDFKTVVVLIGICASIVGGQKWSASGLGEKLVEQSKDIALVNAKMDAIKQHAEDAGKLQDKQNEMVTREMSRLGGQATMIDTKINNMMLGGRR